MRFTLFQLDINMMGEWQLAIGTVIISYTHRSLFAVYFWPKRKIVQIDLLWIHVI